VLRAFVPLRLAAYGRRAKHALATLRDRAQRLASSQRFLAALSSDAIQLDGATDDAVAAQLTAAGLPRMAPERAYGAGEAPAAPGPLAGFEYLLGIPHAARTEAAAAELAAQAAATAVAAKAAETATPEALWRADLAAFEVAYAAAQAEAAIQAAEREAAAAAAVEAYAELERARAAAEQA
jgi:hypothetical protein